MNQYLDLLNEQRALIDAHSSSIINARRDEAARALLANGLPTRHVEAYRYTDVAAALAPNYGLQLRKAPPQTDVPDTYGTLADCNTDAITALNTALAQEVTVLRAKHGDAPGNPIHLRYTSRATAPLMQHRRLMVIAEAGTSLQLIIDETAAEQEMLTTQVTEVFVETGAHVEIYDIEQTHDQYRRFHNLYAHVAKDATFTHAAFTLTCGLSRSQTHVSLAEEGSSTTLLGCAIADGHQHVDANTVITHAAVGCRSEQLYKNVVDDHAEVAFAGRILVPEGSVQTKSIERNANLVCTSTARVWSQPMLEIYADDVECSHGATVGQLPADALFYMRQRGIADADARMLLKQAFAAEVIGMIPLEELRPRLSSLVEHRFRACAECQLCANK